MNKKIYNKLVRDNIPDIIEADNKKCKIKTVAGAELMELLNQKLQEEIDEYIESNDIEELADIVEVIHGILYNRGITIDELESIRLKKKEERGGFSKGVKLLKVEVGFKFPSEDELLDSDEAIGNKQKF
ncbi:MAG TPA: nucleoside triphosphate pyrophosphohydrolase [Oscillospiraceae bacterium]|nr:nucleoside triphosphate pyrophosphohydrolase [Oscillospiraceae bacterium]